MVSTDDEGHLLHCFWSDAISRKDYYHFEDVIVLAATYNTNKYRLNFMPFVGVNHHNQMAMFGVGLLSREIIEDYNWLLTTWLSCMPSSKHPRVIIID